MGGSSWVTEARVPIGIPGPPDTSRSRGRWPRLRIRRGSTARGTKRPSSSPGVFPRDRGLARGVRIDRRHDGRSIGWPPAPARRGAAVRRNRDSRLDGNGFEAARRAARGSRCAARTEDARWLLGDARRPDGVRDHAARPPCAVGDVRSRSGSLRLRRGARHARRIPADRAPRARRVSGKSGGRVGARGLPERLGVPDRGAAGAPGRVARRDGRRASRARPGQRRHEDRGRPRRPAEPRDAAGRARARRPRALPRGRPRGRGPRGQPPRRGVGSRERGLGARQRGLARRVRARSRAAARSAQGGSGAPGSAARATCAQDARPTIFDAAAAYSALSNLWGPVEPPGRSVANRPPPARPGSRSRPRTRARRRAPHPHARGQGDARLRRDSGRAQAVPLGSVRAPESSGPNPVRRRPGLDPPRHAAADPARGPASRRRALRVRCPLPLGTRALAAPGASSTGGRSRTDTGIVWRLDGPRAEPEVRLQAWAIAAGGARACGSRPPSSAPTRSRSSDGARAARSTSRSTIHPRAARDHPRARARGARDRAGTPREGDPRGGRELGPNQGAVRSARCGRRDIDPRPTSRPSCRFSDPPT